MYRNSKGKPRERQPEQKNAQNPPKPPRSRIPEKNFKKTFNAKNLENQHLTQNRQKFLQITSKNIWSLLKNAVPLHSQIRNNAYHANKIVKRKCLKMSCKIDL